MSSAAARIEALSNQLQGALRKGELPTAAEWPVPTLRDVPPLDTPDNWNGAVLEKQTDKYAIRLSDAVIAELEASIASFLATGTPLAHMSRESFPLGEATKALLDRVRNQLFDGFGFALLRGLPVDRWTRTQTAACTLGVGVHLGLLQVQNKLGHTLGHVKDLGRDPNDPTVRYYATRERQQFHTDECDIVGLVCLETSVSGGESLLASSSAVFSYLREHDPAALEILMKPFYWDRKDEQRPGDAPYGVSPIFLYLPPASPASPGRVAVFHDRNFLRTAHRLGLPRLTTEQERALDALHDACDKLAFHMVLSKGDFQLVHNHQMLHDRMGFQDGPGKQRHLLRLWITREGPRGDWEIPRDLLEVRSVFDAPGRTAPLEAE